MSDVEKEMVNLRVIHMKKMSYDPIGCSKSIRLEKVRLRKKLSKVNPFEKVPQPNRYSSFMEHKWKIADFFIFSNDVFIEKYPIIPYG